MKIAFVTFGNFDGHATLKRATGMARPLILAGHEVYLLLEDSDVNREKFNWSALKLRLNGTSEE